MHWSTKRDPVSPAKLRVKCGFGVPAWHQPSAVAADADSGHMSSLETGSPRPLPASRYGRSKTSARPHVSKPPTARRILAGALQSARGRPTSAPIAASTDRSRAATAAAVAATRLRPPTAPIRSRPQSEDTGGAGLDPQRRLVGVRHQLHLKWERDKEQWEAQENRRRDAASRLLAAREAEAEWRRRKKEDWSQRREASLQTVAHQSMYYYEVQQLQPADRPQSPTYSAAPYPSRLASPSTEERRPPADWAVLVGSGDAAAVAEARAAIIDSEEARMNRLFGQRERVRAARYARTR